MYLFTRYLSRAYYVHGIVLSTAQFSINTISITILEADNIIIPLLELKKMRHNNLRNLPTSESYKSGIFLKRLQIYIETLIEIIAT